jgi:hypothetical protein
MSWFSSTPRLGDTNRTQLFSYSLFFIKMNSFLRFSPIFYLLFVFMLLVASRLTKLRVLKKTVDLVGLGLNEKN